MSGPCIAGEKKVLIVGYGNPARGDDGLGWRAAEQIAAQLASLEVDVVRLQQLTPELADCMRSSRAVIFIDAARDLAAGELSCAAVAPVPKDGFSHHLTPGTVLALCRELYSASPPAFSLTLGAESLDAGAPLSETVERALPGLIKVVERLAEELLSASPETLAALTARETDSPARQEARSCV